MLRLVTDVAAKAVSLLSRSAATDLSHGRQPVGRCVFRRSPAGAKESQEIFRPYGAYRHMRRKPWACARGYDLSPRCGSNRERCARYLGQQRTAIRLRANKLFWRETIVTRLYELPAGACAFLVPLRNRFQSGNDQVPAFRSFVSTVCAFLSSVRNQLSSGNDHDLSKLLDAGTLRAWLSTKC